MSNCIKKIAFASLALTYLSLHSSPLSIESKKLANRYFAEKSDVIQLNVYNSEDYIAEDDDEAGTKGIVTQFEEYMLEKGKNVKVNYSCFDTNESMLAQVRMGSSDFDLICTSDYVVQKMIAEDDVVPFEEEGVEVFSNTPNYRDYCSNFIIDKLNSIPVTVNGTVTHDLNRYCRGYMWGTLGLLYNTTFKKLKERGISSKDIETDLNSWLTLWENEKYRKLLSIKDSMRDTYAVGIMKTYDQDFELDGKNYEGFSTLKRKYENGEYTADEYNLKVTEIFNMCDDTTIKRVEKDLSELKEIAYGLEVDSGKSDMARGMYYAINVAWSGDATWAMSMADEFNEEHEKKYPDDPKFNPTILKYKLPETGANIWFDGWVMTKSCASKNKQDIACEFIDFLSDPEHAVENMDYIGYTPVIAGDTILDYVRSTCGDVRYEEIEGNDEEYNWVDKNVEDYTLIDTSKIADVAEEEVDNYIYKKSIAYFFDGTLDEFSNEDAIFYLPISERERLFDTEYPDEEILPRLAIMNDYGEVQTQKVVQSWSRIKNHILSLWVYIVAIIFVVGVIGYFIYAKIMRKRKLDLRKVRKEERLKKQENK